VLAVGTPEADGDDFLTVRVKVGGVTDELRFSPRELSVAGRSGGAARTAQRADETRPRNQDGGPGTSKTASSRAEAGRRMAGTAKRTTTTSRDAPAKRPAPSDDVAPGEQAVRVQRPRKATAGDVPSQQGRSAATAAARGPGAATGTSRRRGASLPTVSVTLTSAGAAWFLSAHRGSRAIVKNASIPPGVVSGVAEILGLPAVSDAVAAVNDVALQEAEARATALRAELAALEAELSSHRRP
jgi:hypothetical protein